MSSVEDRLNALESEIDVLRQELKHNVDWVARISGSMRDFPEFEDVLRSGRDLRRANNGVEQSDNNGR